MHHNAIRLLYAGLAVILLAAAFLLGYTNGKPSGAGLGSLSLCKDRYQEGYDAAHQKLLDSSLLAPSQKRLFAIVGTVKTVGADSITLSTSQTLTDPLAEPAPTERTLSGFSATQIVLRTNKTPERQIEDSQSYNKALIASKGELPPPPLPYDETPSKLADLKPGTMIEVTGKEGEDLTHAQKIEAPTKITIIVQAQ
jgi:hypothetical protein